MNRAVLFHAASGTITSTHMGNIEDMAVLAVDGYDLLGLDASDDELDITDMCVLENQLAARTEITLEFDTLMADPSEVVTISGLPMVCFLRIRNDIIEVTGGSYELTLAEEGLVMVEAAGQYKSETFFVRFSLLEAAKSAVKIQIDTDAEAARTRVVTPGSGQAMTYMRKADAARAFIAGDTLSDAQMLRITDEAARLGVSNEEAAQVLVATADTWEAIDAVIDNTRLVTKKMIDEATTAAQAQAIYEAIAWPV
jgi:hypothetical protein